MAQLRNISTSAKTVGGWQQDQKGTGLPSDASGAAMHLPTILQPGESIEVDRQSLGHPIVVSLAKSADFELLQVAVVPGGPLDAAPGQREGSVRKVTRVLAFDDADVALGATEAIIVTPFILPKNSFVLDCTVETTIAAAALGTVSMGVSVAVGTTTGNDNVLKLVSADAIGLATRSEAAAATPPDDNAPSSPDANVSFFPLGGAVSIRAANIGGEGAVDLLFLTAWSATVHVVYAVLD